MGNARTIKRKAARRCQRERQGPSGIEPRSASPLQPGDQNWRTACENCGARPTVHPTGLCGPCCFGEADTFDGNW